MVDDGLVFREGLDLWNSPRFRIGYALSTMTNDERMHCSNRQLEFLGHLLPRRYRNARKVEPYVFVLEICKCPLKGRKNSPRVSLFQRQVSHDFERSFESRSVMRYALIKQSR
jgi:hypothetical protein